MLLDYLSISLALGIPVTIMYVLSKDGVFQQRSSDFDDSAVIDSFGDMEFSTRRLDPNTGFIEYNDSTSSSIDDA
jgi:hypothetical protein